MPPTTSRVWTSGTASAGTTPTASTPRATGSGAARAGGCGPGASAPTAPPPPGRGLHGGARIGGNAPDSTHAEDDWIGDGEVGGLRAGRLVAPDRGVGEDSESLLIGEDVGIDGAAASAEEAAMHVIERLPEDSDSE